MCSTSDFYQFIGPNLLRDDEQYKSCSFVETTKDVVSVEDQSLKDDEHEIMLSVKLVERKELTTKYPD